MCNLSRGYLVKNPFASQSLPRRGFQSMTGIESVTAAVITLVYCLKSDEIGSIRHTITWIAVTLLANADVNSYCYFNGQRRFIFQETSLHQGPGEFLTGAHRLLILLRTLFGQRLQNESYPCKTDVSRATRASCKAL